jgi:hypothetical protein
VPPLVVVVVVVAAFGGRIGVAGGVRERIWM